MAAERVDRALRGLVCLHRRSAGKILLSGALTQKRQTKFRRRWREVCAIAIEDLVAFIASSPRADARPCGLQEEFSPPRVLLDEREALTLMIGERRAQSAGPGVVSVLAACRE
jgi:riboflavin biosynthesis pyrimidine reductase